MDNEDVANLLIQYSADVNATDQHGNTQLYSAYIASIYRGFGTIFDFFGYPWEDKNTTDTKKDPNKPPPSTKFKRSICEIINYGGSGRKVGTEENRCGLRFR